MQKVEFTFDEKGKQRYEICFQAIALSVKPPAVEDWADVTDLIKKLKSVGEEAEQKVNGQKLYDLQEGGGHIFLEKSEMRLLLGFVKQPVWRPMAVEDALNVQKWLESIPRESGSLKQDARPEEKRRAALQLEGDGAPPVEVVRAQ